MRLFRFRLPAHLRDTRHFDEQTRYDRLSEDLPDFLLSRENPLIWQNDLRYPYFQKRFGALAGQRILDIGCGWGILAACFVRDQARVIGLDVSRSTLLLNRRSTNLPPEQSALIQGRSEALPFPPVFEVVTATDLLEHVENLEATLAEVSRVLKPGGSFGFVTVNKTALARFVYITVGERILGLLPRGTHRYANFISPRNLKNALRKQGLETEDIRGIFVNPVLKKYHFWPSLSIEYIGIARKTKS